MRYLLALVVLLSPPAFAGDAGVSPEVRAAAELGAPTWIDGVDGWQAPTTDAPGGFVRVIRYADEAAARAAFAFAARSSASRALPPLAGVGHEAVGDGGFLVARVADRVWTIRDPSGDAAGRLQKLQRPVR